MELQFQLLNSNSLFVEAVFLGSDKGGIMDVAVNSGDRIIISVQEQKVVIPITVMAGVPEPSIWDRDIRAELATNASCPGILVNGWWKRKLDQINGVTVHHTLSGSPHATADYYIHKGGGRPSLPYTFWVTQTGEILWCVALEEGLWHDHTGHANTHLSVGMAGNLHIERPPDVQLEATVKLIRWVIRSDIFPGVYAGSQVKGHLDYASTVCPGWNEARSGYWRTRFYNQLTLS